MASPTGTVTFLFTDIEGSTCLWQEQPEAMSVAHTRNDELLREAIETNHGYILQIVGDSFSAAFPNAMDGLCAVLADQRCLKQTSEVLKLRVRMEFAHRHCQALDGGQVHDDGAGDSFGVGLVL